MKEDDVPILNPSYQALTGPLFQQHQPISIAKEIGDVGGNSEVWNQAATLLWYFVPKCEDDSL